MDYLRSQKIIHWLMAVAIILDLIIAQKFWRRNGALGSVGVSSRSRHHEFNRYVFIHLATNPSITILSA
jgi:cytochrome b561